MLNDTSLMHFKGKSFSYKDIKRYESGRSIFGVLKLILGFVGAFYACLALPFFIFSYCIFNFSELLGYTLSSDFFDGVRSLSFLGFLLQLVAAVIFVAIIFGIVYFLSKRSHYVKLLLTQGVSLQKEKFYVSEDALNEFLFEIKEVEKSIDGT